MENEITFQSPVSAALTVDELTQVLTGAGHFNTRARRAVLEALFSATAPLNPGEILQAGRVRHSALGLVTVYRTLDVLLSLNLVSKLHLQDGCHSYVLSTAGIERRDPYGDHADEHGHHVICSLCGRAVEFDGCDVESVVAMVEAKTGFLVREHWLELFGLCPQCRTQEGAVA